MYLQKQEFPVLEPGEYLVKVESCQQTDGKYGNQLRFLLRVLHAGGELSDALLMAWAAPTLTPKSKLTRWAGALLGAGWPGNDLETDTLVGKVGRAVVTITAGSDGLDCNKVVDLVPLRRAAPLPAAAAPVQVWPGPVMAPGNEVPF